MRPCLRKMEVMARDEVEYGREVWEREEREEVRSWVIRFAGGVFRCMMGGGWVMGDGRRREVTGIYNDRLKG